MFVQYYSVCSVEYRDEHGNKSEGHARNSSHTAISFDEGTLNAGSRSTIVSPACYINNVKVFDYK
jgi:hypothetical protein